MDYSVIVANEQRWREAYLATSEDPPEEATVTEASDVFTEHASRGNQPGHFKNPIKGQSRNAGKGKAPLPPGNQPGNEEFCFVENDPQAEDKGQVVCLELGGATQHQHREKEEARQHYDPVRSLHKTISTIMPLIERREPNEHARQSNEETDRPSKRRKTDQVESTSAATILPVEEGRREAWFSSTQPPPGTGPLGLGDSDPLGGVLCMYSMTNNKSHRSKRAMRVRPAPWFSVFDSEDEIYAFWLSFAKRLDAALQTYKKSGLFPALIWHCSTIRAKALDPFRPGAEAVIPDLTSPVNGVVHDEP